MRVLLDTNVILAAFAARGLCASLFELCLLEQQIVVSENLLEEIRRNLVKKIKLSPASANEIISLLKHHADIIKPSPLSAPVCRDPDDDAILGLGRAAKADYIVTGDEDLLSLKELEEIPILNPRSFWAALKKVKRP